MPKYDYTYSKIKNWLTEITQFKSTKKKKKTQSKAIKKSREWLIQITLWEREG